MDTKTRAMVAKNVKLLREAKGWNQTVLGHKAAVGQTSVSSVEKPDGKSPTLDTLDKISTALGLPCWILTVTDLSTLDPAALDGIRRTIEAYVSLPPPGQHQVERVAESESRYAQLH